MMISELTFMCRAMFALWAVVICGLGLSSIVFALAIKRYKYAPVPLIAVVPAFILWLVIYDLNIESVSPAIRLDTLSWVIWVIALIALTMVGIFTFASNIRYNRSYITPMAIKHCGDEMDCGICYWQNNGRVVFSNKCMDRLCIELTGRPLMNGEYFYKEVPQGMTTIGDKVWRFVGREFDYNGRRLHELVAYDVTEIHAKAEVLRKDNEELSRIKASLNAYSLKIDEHVRKQEILQAKVKIHDEMNKLMLSTMAADIDSKDELDHIFDLWEQNAILLGSDSLDNEEDTAIRQISSLADALGLAIIWKHELPSTFSKEQRELFFAAFREAIANAVKHGNASSLDVDFTNENGGICCTFENDGTIPKGDIRFTGGLKNLAILAGEQDARVTAKTGETFKLSVHFRMTKEGDYGI